MDAEQKKHNERVMQAMEVQAELMLSLLQAIADAAEKTVRAITLSAPILSRALTHLKFQSWCASEVTKIQNIGGTLEVQARYDQMLLDSGQVFPPDTDPKHEADDLDKQESGSFDLRHGETVVIGEQDEDPDPLDHIESGD